MKKWIISLVVISVVVLISAVTIYSWKKTPTSYTLVDVFQSYEEEWGIQIPIPDSREVLHSSAAAFGDGEWFEVYTYLNSGEQIAESGLVEIIEVNIDVANHNIV